MVFYVCGKNSWIGSLFQALSRNIVQLIIFRSLTGLFAGSNILVQACFFDSLLISSVIADLTAPEERNRYYSCLEALNSAGFILGPALGAVLGKKGTHFPLYIAGIFSGIALIFAFFLLHETSKDVILLNEMRAKARKASGSNHSLASITPRGEGSIEAIDPTTPSRYQAESKDGGSQTDENDGGLLCFRVLQSLVSQRDRFEVRNLPQSQVRRGAGHLFVRFELSF